MASNVSTTCWCEIYERKPGAGRALLPGVHETGFRASCSMRRQVKRYEGIRGMSVMQAGNTGHSVVAMVASKEGESWLMRKNLGARLLEN